jgi:membrane-associated protease RseP (regulator of RpoE activity)
MASLGLRHALVLYLALLLHHLLFVASAWGLLVAGGGRARGISVGLLRVVHFQAGGMKVRLGLLPLTAYVDVAGMSPTDDDEDAGSWRTLPLSRRLLVTVLPWLLVLGVAVLCLGPGRALTSAARAPSQLLLVLDVTPLVRGFLHVLSTEPFAVVLGVLCAKSAIFNLLPIGSLAGARVIVEVATALRPAKQRVDKPSSFWILTFVALVLWLWGRFAWGVFHALR